MRSIKIHIAEQQLVYPTGLANSHNSYACPLKHKAYLMA